MAHVVCEHKCDAKIGHHTHDKFGEKLVLRWLREGEDQELHCPFTVAGLNLAKQHVAENGGWFEDNYGQIWAE